MAIQKTVIASALAVIVSTSVAFAQEDSDGNIVGAGSGEPNLNVRVIRNDTSSSAGGIIVPLLLLAIVAAAAAN